MFDLNSRFSDSFNFLVNLPEEKHIWCDFSDLMVPLLETFHNYFKDANCDSPLKILWKRVSQELGHCTQCICQHHHAQEYYNVEYETDSVDPLLTVLQCLDEERITDHLRNINAKIRCKEYNPEFQGTEIVGAMFEVCYCYSILNRCLWIYLLHESGMFLYTLLVLV